jgi:hypothetical protein
VNISILVGKYIDNCKIDLKWETELGKKNNLLAILKHKVNITPESCIKMHVGEIMFD